MDTLSPSTYFHMIWMYVHVYHQVDPPSHHVYEIWIPLLL